MFHECQVALIVTPALCLVISPYLERRAWEWAAWHSVRRLFSLGAIVIGKRSRAEVGKT